MNKDIQAIKEAWEKRPAAGIASSGDTGAKKAQNDKKIVAMADEYVANHPEIYDSFQDVSLEDCIAVLESFRAGGMEDKQWEIEIWILHHWEPQQIGGPVTATVRVAPEDK